MKIACVVGARPNFMKIAPILEEIEKYPELDPLLIHSLTIRENTERPETLRSGTNTLVGNDTQLIIQESRKILDGNGKTGAYPEIRDGHTAERIVKLLDNLNCL